MKKPIIFLGGRSDTGKSASLRNLCDPSRVLYLNFEGKDLPFKSGFKEVNVNDPYTLHEITHKLIEKGKKQYDVLVVDSITACMALFSTVHIGKDCPNKMAAWGDYGSFYEVWAKQLLPQLEQTVVVLAHIDYYEEPGELDGYFQAVVQGRLKHIGLEADFSVVVNTALLPTEKLVDYPNKNLVITDDEEIEGFKHVLQVRKTLETKDTKIRAPMGMWDKTETYIDSDVQIVLARIINFYN